MKMPECDHDFEECEINNPYNYNFNMNKKVDINDRKITWEGFERVVG